MISVFDTERSRALDRHTVRVGRLGEIDLMRNAGRVVAVEAAKLLRGDTDRPVVVVCGKGHNGGDGIAAAGFLARWGYSCSVHLLSDIEGMDAVVGETYRLADVQLLQSARPEDVDWTADNLVIDALLGIGVDRPLGEPLAAWVQAINEQPGPVLAVDVPTGLSTDTGRSWETAIKADVTVTMGHPKLGLLIGDGPDLAGRVVVAHIGFAALDISEDDTGHFQFTGEDFSRLFHPPARRTYKHRQGKTLVIAGSQGMTGAAVLTARATVLSGSGLTLVACPASIQQLYAPSMPEVITLGLEDHQRGIFLPEHVSAIQEPLSWCSAVVMGPGLSRSPQVKEFVQGIFEHLEAPILLDADGLMAFTDNMDLLNAAGGPLVLTPHAQEFASLFDHELQEVMDDPAGVLAEVRSYFPHTVVLKGAPTLTLLSTGDIIINSTGNPGMATAGSGDVLSGIIGTFLSQNYSPDEAAIMGVFIHGRGGDLARAEVGVSGMNALQILEHLPAALARYDSAA
ncbi:MAG: NAD(P)H-hydrate dehydratase [Candidatus Marinimicrobia bacterium]|nr:NAD(P)H-hydrate dehydratase [Candidatus Neomarinimicrobiota bacterium]